MTDLIAVELVGRRLLCKVKRGAYGDPPVSEYRLLEISPSQNWLKMRDLRGHQFWVRREDVGLVEELRDLRAERMAERETLR